MSAILFFAAWAVAMFGGVFCDDFSEPQPLGTGKKRISKFTKITLSITSALLVASIVLFIISRTA